MSKLLKIRPKPQTKITRTQFCRVLVIFSCFFSIFIAKLDLILRIWVCKGHRLNFQLWFWGRSHASCFWVNDHFKSRQKLCIRLQVGRKRSRYTKNRNPWAAAFNCFVAKTECPWTRAGCQGRSTGQCGRCADSVAENQKLL